MLNGISSEASQHIDRTFPFELIQFEFLKKEEEKKLRRI